MNIYLILFAIISSIFAIGGGYKLLSKNTPNIPNIQNTHELTTQDTFVLESLVKSEIDSGNEKLSELKSKADDLSKSKNKDNNLCHIDIDFLLNNYIKLNLPDTIYKPFENILNSPSKVLPDKFEEFKIIMYQSIFALDNFLFAKKNEVDVTTYEMMITSDTFLEFIKKEIGHIKRLDDYKRLNHNDTEEKIENDYWKKESEKESLWKTMYNCANNKHTGGKRKTKRKYKKSRKTRKTKKHKKTRKPRKTKKK